MLNIKEANAILPVFWDLGSLILGNDSVPKYRSPICHRDGRCLVFHCMNPINSHR